MRLKGKFYRSVVRSTMLNDSECWAVDSRIEQSMSVVEMRMPRWLSGVITEDRIRNEYVRGSIGVATIVDKMRENRLRWFGHLMRRQETKVVRAVMKINVEGKQARVRPKKRWLDTIENYTRAVG
jgi:hypothetical protein